MNIFVSLLAGLAIFPVVFAFGLAPDEGPGLLFMVLPEVFGQMPFGELFLALFLLLFLFATLTSSFSLYEIIVAAITANGKHTRKTVAWLTGLIVFVAAIPSAMSSSLLESFTINGKNIFDNTDYLVSNIFLPLGNLLIAIFIIHKMDRELVKQEFNLSTKDSPGLFRVWIVLMTVVVPVTIVAVFLNNL